MAECNPDFSDKILNSDYLSSFDEIFRHWLYDYLRIQYNIAYNNGRFSEQKRFIRNIYEDGNDSIFYIMYNEIYASVSYDSAQPAILIIPEFVNSTSSAMFRSITYEVKIYYNPLGARKEGVFLTNCLLNLQDGQLTVPATPYSEGGHVGDDTVEVVLNRFVGYDMAAQLYQNTDAFYTVDPDQICNYPFVPIFNNTGKIDDTIFPLNEDGGLEVDYLLLKKPEVTKMTPSDRATYVGNIIKIPFMIFFDPVCVCGRDVVYDSSNP